MFAPGLGIGHRRLSIVGLADGGQPIYNEDKTVAVMFNGELFDYPEQRASLEAKGHKFQTHADTEIIVHLYEEHGEDVFKHLCGQFAIALVDLRRRTVFLARDRVGICPLHWSRQGDWIYFASEVKGILASGEIPAVCDPKGLDHVFNFFALGTRRTMFEGVQSVLPGHYLKIAFSSNGSATGISERRYWDFEFADAGEEDNPSDITPLVDEFEQTFRRAVELRLRADVPVVSYLSGGVDSAYVLATAAKIRGLPPPSFTIRVPSGKLDETSHAMVTARAVGSAPTVVVCDGKAISSAYAKLITAADSPVTDTSCAALLDLAREVHNQGYKVALTGEGADEAFAGYVWFKTHKFSRLSDHFGLRASAASSRVLRNLMSRDRGLQNPSLNDTLTGGPHAQSEVYALVAMARESYYSAGLKNRLRGFSVYEDVPLDLERMKRWHPLNQSLYLGYKIHLPGLLLNHKGDRVAMASSVETRYPFLDDGVLKFTGRIHPRFKLKGLARDKFLLRKAAERILPKEVAWRPKGMFRAPFAESFFVNQPAFVRQLMSEESLKKTGYFDVTAVRRDYQSYVDGTAAKWRFFSSMGLGGVLATQLWHHINLGGGLCELPAADYSASRQHSEGGSVAPSFAVNG